MLSKKQLLLKTIRDLLALKVPFDEILLNLKEVSIDKEQGRKLIEEAKRQPAKPGEESVKKGFVEGLGGKEKKRAGKRLSEEEKAKIIERDREEASEQLAAEAVETEEKIPAEEIAEEIGVEEPSKKGKQKASLSDIISEVKKPAKKTKGEKPAKEWAAEPFVKTPAVEAGEEEPAVDAEKEKPAERLAEEKPMPRLIEDIRISKLWEKGILGTVNQRLAEMKEIKKSIDSVLDKKIAAASKRELEKMKVLFDSQRLLLISKVEAEIGEKAKGFAEMIGLKLREMREINKRIANQIEDLKEAKKKSKAEEETLSRRLKEIDKVKEDLVASLNSEIIKSKTNSKQLVEEMNKKSQLMDERINKTLQLENQIVEGLAREAEQRIEKMIASFEAEQQQKLARIEDKSYASREALDNQIKERLIKLDRLQGAITVEFKPEKFRRQMNELNEFKSQFVDAIQRNAKRFNEGIRRLNNQSQVIEKQFMLRAEKIDKKIAELDAFEKNFAKEIGLSLEKMTKKGKNNKKG